MSVIIPTYGRAEFLADALASLERQTCQSIEVLVVDDHSPLPIDVPRSERVHTRLVTHSRNMGPGAARNTGLAHARGEYVVFLDDDDLLEPHRIQQGLRDIGEARMHATATNHAGRIFQGDMRTTLPHGKVPLTGQALFRRDDYVQFDPTLRVAEDVEWWLRMSDRAVFAWSSIPGVHIRAHSSERHGVDPEVRLRCRVEVLQRHLAHLDREGQIVQLNRVASAALRAQKRGQVFRYSSRSMLRRPNLSAVRLLRRCVMPSLDIRTSDPRDSDDGPATE